MSGAKGKIAVLTSGGDAPGMGGYAEGTCGT